MSSQIFYRYIRDLMLKLRNDEAQPIKTLDPGSKNLTKNFLRTNPFVLLLNRSKFYSFRYCTRRATPSKKSECFIFVFECYTGNKQSATRVCRRISMKFSNLVFVSFEGNSRWAMSTHWVDLFEILTSKYHQVNVDLNRTIRFSFYRV